MKIQHFNISFPIGKGNLKYFLSLIDVGDYQVSGYVTGVYPLPDHPVHPGGHGTIKGPNSTIQSFWLRFGQGIRCSWKLVAIFFMILSFFLVSAFIFSAGWREKSSYEEAQHTNI